MKQSPMGYLGVPRWRVVSLVAALGALAGSGLWAEDPPEAAGDAPAGTGPALEVPDGEGADWRKLGAADFVTVNGNEDTWSWREDGSVASTGNPVSVARSVEPLEDFELLAEWRHLSSGGNSGFFVWVPMDALDKLDGPGLPDAGIEVQVLDLGYAEKYKAQTGKDPEWFTCHGDVFAVGRSKMDPFPPLSPNGSRSFPREERSRPSPQWNHYYVRAVDGVVRLWVNGAEVSGGANCDPSTGHLCLEAEGAPIEFRNLKIRLVGEAASADDDE